MLAHRPYSRYPLPKPLSSGEGLAAEAADYSSIFVFLDEVCGVQEQTVQVHGQAVQVHGQAAQVPGQAVQVPALKWNLRHRGASVSTFATPPAGVRTKNQHSSAVSMYVYQRLWRLSC